MKPGISSWSTRSVLSFASRATIFPFSVYSFSFSFSFACGQASNRMPASASVSARFTSADYTKQSAAKLPAYVGPRRHARHTAGKEKNPMSRRNTRSFSLALLATIALIVPNALASSHREALAVLNEPCADNTDTFAWVSDGTHDKLYIIMDYNPLHEPGQGNQALRACDGYRYEFHIGKGASLADQAVYRVEFKNTLTSEAAPS